MNEDLKKRVMTASTEIFEDLLKLPMDEFRQLLSSRYGGDISEILAPHRISDGTFEELNEVENGRE